MRNNREIYIYTSSLCGFCYKAKSLLNKKKFLFKEINIDLNYEKRKEMISKSKGRTSVPQIFIGNFHLGGCDELFQLEEENKLDALIN